jgi:hypothetical protein
MRTKHTIRCSLLFIALSLSLGNTEAKADLSSITRLAFVGNDVFVVFTPQTTNWVALEASDDLSTWTEVADVATTNSGTFFVDQAAALSPCRFYRLRQPGTTADDARAMWPTDTNLNYQFQLIRVTYTGFVSLLTATVTVTAGQKIISNAQANGQPIAQPDPADFPSVEELFAALRSAQQMGCRQVWAIYDPVLRYPVECIIDQRVAAFPPQAGGQVDHYLISGLKVNGS